MNNFYLFVLHKTILFSHNSFGVVIVLESDSNNVFTFSNSSILFRTVHSL